MADRDPVAPDVRRHMPPLDGLRGVAILLVLLFHGTVVRSGSPGEALLHGLFRNFGWTGVDLFFVLSGFLITGLLLDAKGSSHYLRNFYARRALRIFPVYYGFLAGVFLVVPRLAPDLLTVDDDGIWYWLYLQNFATAAAGDWTHSRLLNLFWSLAIEEQFYLVWPWVVLWLGRRTLMTVCVAALAASLTLRLALVLGDVAPVSIYVLTPARLDGLAVGAWLACAARNRGGLVAWARLARPTLLGAGLGLLGLVVWQRGFSFLLPGTATLGLTLLAVFFGALLLLVLCASPTSPASRALGGATLRMFGRYSYALYVVHQAVLVLATKWLAESVFEPWWPEAPLLAYQAAVYVTLFAGSLGVAALSWRFFERPILRWKERFPRVE